MAARKTYIQESFIFAETSATLTPDCDHQDGTQDGARDGTTDGTGDENVSPEGEPCLFGPLQLTVSVGVSDGQLSFLAPPAPSGDGAEAQTADSGEPPLVWNSLDELARTVKACTACRLRAGCTQVVFGEGSPRAAVMFVGEGPGETEDQLGRPFVGRAGQLLDQILTASGFNREEVYITNTVKCRPPGNRQPDPSEAQTCLPWLRAQMRLIRPKLVVCLGAAATATLLDPKLRITAARGKWHERNGMRYMPTFHPAALLRDPSKKRPVWEDMKKVRAEYERLRGKGGAER
jgi:DNA polymerase